MAPEIKGWALSDKDSEDGGGIHAIGLDLFCPKCSQNYTGYFRTETAKRIVLGELGVPICDRCQRGVGGSNDIQS